MRIMGIDPSITCTGLSYPDASTQAVKPPARVKGDDRLVYLADHIGLAVRTCRADVVVMEGLFGVYKGEAARIIPMVHGVIRLELKRHGVPYVVLHPSTLKRFATGDGSADKDRMALEARKRLGRTYPTNDECDADWCRIAGRFAYGLGEWVPPDLGGVLSLPLDQLGALQRTEGKKGKPIDWPTVGAYRPWPRVALR